MSVEKWKAVGWDAVKLIIGLQMGFLYEGVLGLKAFASVA
jgi:hypothetical protein